MLSLSFGEKRGKGKCVPPLFPSLIPQLNSFSPPGATAFQNTHKNFLFFSSQTLPSNLTSRRGKKIYITLNQMALSLNNKNKEIKRLCNLWQVIKLLFTVSFSLYKMQLSDRLPHTHTHSSYSLFYMCLVHGSASWRFECNMNAEGSKNKYSFKCKYHICIIFVALML